MSGIKTNYIVLGLFCHGGVFTSEQMESMDRDGMEMPPMDYNTPLITPEYQTSDNDNVYMITCADFTNLFCITERGETRLYRVIKEMIEDEPNLNTLSIRQTTKRTLFEPGESETGKTSSSSSLREFDKRLDTKLTQVVDNIKRIGTHYVYGLASVDNPDKDSPQFERACVKITKNELIPNKIFTRDPAPNQTVPFGDIIVISTDNPSIEIGVENPWIWGTTPEPTLSFLISLFKIYARNVIIFDFTCSSIVADKASSRHWLKTFEKIKNKFEKAKAGGRKRKTRRKRIRKRATRKNKRG
jgi:hypothetical protein